MKRASMAMLAGALAIGAASPRVTQPTLEQIDNAMSAQSGGYALLKDLTTSIGPRMTGSAKGRQAEQWGLSQFRKAGYANARFDPFALTVWERGPLSLSVDGTTLPAMALGGSPASVDISSEIVDMRDGVEQDYKRAPERARGKIVLVYYTVSPDSPDDTPFLMRWDKIKLALKYGAKALVFINRGHGDVLATGTGWLDGPIPIPVLIVGHDAGLSLRERLKPGALQARLTMTNKVGPGTARNIVATLPGTDPTADKIVFGAHLDSWDPATGALDNGAGAATLLDVARLFKKEGYRPKRTIEFVLFMGEEQGELGSTAFAQSDEKGRRGRTGYMLNTDMSYDPVGINVWGFDVDQDFYSQLLATLNKAVPTLSKTLAHQPMPGGDPEPFLLKGIPVLYLLGNETPYFQRCQHSSCDRLDIIQPDKMVVSARVEAMLLWSLANASHLPASRLSGPALDDYLSRNHLKL